MSSIQKPSRDRLGDSLTALCGGALALNLLLILALLGLLLANGGGYFWQKPLEELTLADGRVLLGEIHDRKPVAARAGETVAPEAQRIQLKVGNRDLDGIDFLWLDESEIVSRSRPLDTVVLERLEWGNFYGRMVELRRGSELLAAGPEEVWKAFGPLHEEKLREREAIRKLEKGPIGDVNHAIERLRLERRKVALARLPAAAEEARLAGLEAAEREREAEYEALAERLFSLRAALDAEVVLLEAADGRRKELPVGAVVRALRPNTFGFLDKLALNASRLGEFVFDDPRESNTEGGIFPAIFGTVMMVFLMSFAVVPFGVLAALYLREYAKQGPLVRAVRIAVNNLAGVPSIVFGVFGLGFFVYLVGGSIDRLFYPEALPTPTFGTGGILWGALTLALLTVPVVIVATEEGLAAVPRIVREGSLALGATKFETTFKVVLPAAAPGILTGMILAMARAAGEVAPLMIVGMVKLAPALPVDGNFPFVHLERKFMHLGFHIYDVGFQSPNVDATKPLVFATALLLIAVVTTMNLVAIAIRNHLRRKYAGSAV
ncbi:MAG: phosphate ABC transporter permease PstA [Thermoanaerobaculia bacterium]|nr:phosphate ABC transporter permease PstA [Thermoanaerobaculia bacterium]MCZ7649859.1 phosphate ABC transporter permease PstA [Thermoanaerobaculia bacterium]